MSVNLQSTKNSQIIYVLIISITGIILVAIFQPHTRTVFNCIDSVLFGGLVIIFTLWKAGQNDHNIIQVMSFFIPLPFITTFVCWKLIKKLGVGGTLEKLYLYFHCCCFQGIRFRELSTRNSSASAQERKPILNKEISPAGVPCTVVAIAN